MNSGACAIPRESGRLGGAFLSTRLCILLCLSGLLLLAGLVGLSVGAGGFAPLRAAQALFTDLGRETVILRELRLPRVLMGALIGVGLGTAGALTQAVLKNPLASPFTLGLASSAGFGASLVIVFVPGAGEAAVAVGAASSCSLAAMLVLAVSRLNRVGPETLILTGVALQLLFSALTSFLQLMSSSADVHRIVFWFFGNLSKAGFPQILAAAAMILPVLPLALYWANDLNCLPAGDDAAKSLGVPVERRRTLGVAAAALLTAGAVCFTGVVGFIGLMAPHMARFLVGTDHRFLLPASALLGAALILLADAAGRTLIHPAQIPIGIMTAFMGVPFFFHLLFKRRSGL